MDRTPLTPSAVPLLSQPMWLSLGHDMRRKLVQLFGIKRSGATETSTARDGITRVISDGYTSGDLLAVTTEAMQQLLGSDSRDFYHLFEIVTSNIDSLIDGTYLLLEEPVADEVGTDENDVVPSIEESERAHGLATPAKKKTTPAKPKKK